MKTADELKHISFPECYKDCKAAEYLGVGECENVCQFKFDEAGEPVKQQESTQKSGGIT